MANPTNDPELIDPEAVLERADARRILVPAQVDALYRAYGEGQLTAVRLQEALSSTTETTRSAIERLNAMTESFADVEGRIHADFHETARATIASLNELASRPELTAAERLDIADRLVRVLELVTHAEATKGAQRAGVWKAMIAGIVTLGAATAGLALAMRSRN